MILRWMLIVALMLSGCAMVPPEPLRVRLTDLRPVSATLFAQTLQLSLQVDNPNAQTLRVRAGEARLYVQGRQIATGLLDQPVTLPAYGSAVVQVPVTGNFLAVVSDLPGLMQKNGLPYTVEGYLVMAPWDLRVPIHVSGNLTLPALPPASAGAP